MIYSIRGTVLKVESGMAVVEVGGVGFRCLITGNTARQMPAIGNEVRLYTVLNVREDALELVGFCDQQELDYFKLLTAISGVGSKVALSILTELSPARLAAAVAAGDIKSITAAQGVGKKTAERIVLELKDKVGAAGADGMEFGGGNAAPAAGNAAEAVQALIGLGVSAGEAAMAVGKLDETLPVERLVRLALKSLAPR